VLGVILSARSEMNFQTKESVKRFGKGEAEPR
jgi:hypothetical protein